VAESVVDKLNLTEQASFNLDIYESSKGAFIQFLQNTKDTLKGFLPFLPQQKQITISPEQRLLDKRKFATNTLMENLSIKPLVNTQVVEISYINEDAELAALIANTVADVYIESYLQAKLEMTAKATSWLNESLQGLRTKLNAAESALAAFDEKEQLVNVDGVASLASDELQKLNNQLIEAQVTLQRNEAIYQQVSQRNANLETLATLPDVLNHPSIQSVKRKKCWHKVNSLT